MSALVSVASGQHQPATTPAPAHGQAKPSRRRHTPGGVTLGKDASRPAQKLAAAILEVLAGVRTPSQAAEALGMSLPRYFQVETRAMHALVISCEARPRGRTPSADQELAALRRQRSAPRPHLSARPSVVRLLESG